MTAKDRFVVLFNVAIMLRTRELISNKEYLNLFDKFYPVLQLLGNKKISKQEYKQNYLCDFKLIAEGTYKDREQEQKKFEKFYKIFGFDYKKNRENVTIYWCKMLVKKFPTEKEYVDNAIREMEKKGDSSYSIYNAKDGIKQYYNMYILKNAGKEMK